MSFVKKTERTKKDFVMCRKHIIYISEFVRINEYIRNALIEFDLHIVEGDCE